MATKRTYHVERKDILKFRSAIKEGPTSFYLRGHLLLERILLQAVKAKVPHPEKLLKANIKMATLIDLVASFGLIDDGMVAILRYIDSVRNNLAHSLDFELTKAVPKRLFQLFEDIKIMMLPQQTWQEDLENCLIVAYSMLDGQMKKATPGRRKKSTK